MAKLPTLVPTVLKGLVGKPATRPYPATARPAYAGARGAIVNDEASCILCGLCAKRCPTGCIEVDKQGKLWAHDPFRCILCGVCVESCPSGSLKQTEDRPGLLTARGRTELHPDPPKKNKDEK